MTNVLDQVRELETQIVERLRELEPLVREYQELRQAADRLGVTYEPTLSSATTTARRPSRPRASNGRRKRTGARRRKAAGANGKRSSRRDDVLRLVGEHPGITVPDIGARLGVDPTGLYRIVRALDADGLIAKDGANLRLAAGPG
jgi:hypothetical protein